MTFNEKEAFRVNSSNEGDPNTENEPEDKYLMRSFWKSFHFPTEPPKPDTPVEERLMDSCKQYVNTVLNSGKFASSSDAARRDLHNAIAIMTYGQARSDMDDYRSKQVADFAFSIVTGMTRDEHENKDDDAKL